MKRILTHKINICTIVLGLLLSAPYVYAQQYDAVLQWSKRAALGTLSSGVIDKVVVDVGDRAKQGDMLLRLDPQVFEKRVQQSLVATKSVEENYLEAKRERERSEELYNRTVLSDHDLQVAKNNEISARALFEHAKLQHEKAKYDFKYSQIIAPFNLLVLERYAQPGQVVSSEMQPPVLLVVADADTMRARIIVSESELDSIQIGQNATIDVAKMNFSGKVVAIGFEPTSDKSATAGYPVDIEFATQGKLLRAGLTAKVMFQ